MSKQGVVIGLICAGIIGIAVASIPVWVNYHRTYGAQTQKALRQLADSERRSAVATEKLCKTWLRIEKMDPRLPEFCKQNKIKLAKLMEQ